LHVHGRGGKESEAEAYEESQKTTTLKAEKRVEYLPRLGEK